jgi:hypothetical protein
MLSIRSKQREALLGVMHQEYGLQLAHELGEVFREDCEILGDEPVRRAVSLGLERAEAHGFQCKADVQRYVTLMFLHGSGFDEDPLIPWAAQILHDERLVGASVRMQVLHTTSDHYLVQSAGSDGEHYRSALLRAHQLPYERLVEAGSGDPMRDIQHLLYEIYPHGYLTLGRRGLTEAVALAERVAREHEMEGRESVALLCVMMLLIGSHFDCDPLHPWASAALQQAVDPDQKAAVLHRAAIEQLERYRFVRVLARRAAR